MGRDLAYRVHSNAANFKGPIVGGIIAVVAATFDRREDRAENRDAPPARASSPIAAAKGALKVCAF